MMFQKTFIIKKLEQIARYTRELKELLFGGGDGDFFPFGFAGLGNL